MGIFDIFKKRGESKNSRSSEILNTRELAIVDIISTQICEVLFPKLTQSIIQCKQEYKEKGEIIFTLSGELNPETLQKVIVSMNNDEKKGISISSVQKKIREKVLYDTLCALQQQGFEARSSEDTIIPSIHIPIHQESPSPS